MSIRKIDPTIAFAFYLKDDLDLKILYRLFTFGRERYEESWPFSLMDLDWA
jgi:hypothetical protein